MMKVEVLSGPPGCGKSHLMREEAIANPGRYIFFYPTAKLIAEQEAEFRKIPGLDVQIAYAKSRRSGSVQDQLNADAERARIAGIIHTIELTTHESLMGCDLSPFQDWHFRIDEAPNAVQSGKIGTTINRQFFQTRYDLDPLGTDGWSEVRPRGSADRFTDIARDDGAKGYAAFLKHADRWRGFVSVSNWKSKQFEWLSIWSPDLLKDVPASVTIAGASYRTSIGALVAEGRVTFSERVVPAVRTGQPSIAIRYFTQGHSGTSSLWERTEGRVFIVKLCDYLAANEPALGFWSGNEEVQKLMDHRVHGGPIPPKVAGLNALEDKLSCAFIYSSKATPHDGPLKSVLGITDQQIRIAREDEDILQFIMRGAARKRDYSGPYLIYLYSLDQAERLRDQLNASGIGATVELEPVPDAGFMDAPLPMGRRKPKAAKVTSPTGKRINASSAKQTERRHKKATEAGRVPGKAGRPTKAR
tara:strand:+ start:32 stop:1450 length:1419 start_codon:yes stop_codon:yes gene_type:complete